jgi:hypothetical protein
MFGTTTGASGETGGSTSTLHNAGVLRLHLGAQDNFSFQVPAPSPPGHYIPTVPPTTQSVAVSSGCKLPTTGSLAAFSVEPSSASPGFFADSIGVRVNSEGNGQPCGRIDSPSQVLAMKLGPGLSGKMIDFAEIDIEGKFDAVLDIYGYSVTGACPPSNHDPEFDDAGAHGHYDMTLGGSDSGPDSADGDNYRLRFPEAGMTAVNCLVFKPSAGGTSLEGGSDGTGPCDASDGCIEPSLGQTIDDTSAGAATFTTDSLFHLIEADGVLDCGDAVEQTNNGITTTVARLANAGGGTCTPIPYNQDSSQDTEACNPDDPDGAFLQCIFLQKDIDEQQAQFFWKVVWAPEDGSYMEEPTQFDFGDGNGFVALQLCGPSTGPVVPPFPPELGFPTFYPSPSTDPWCVVNTQTNLQSNGQVVVTEIFFGQFDPTGRR